MSGILSVRVLTPSRRLAEVECTQAVIPTAQGQITVLPGHASLLASLGVGVLELHTTNGLQRMVVCHGAVEVDQRRVLVLAEVGEHVSDIDVDRARRSLKDAEGQLKSLDPLSPAYADETERARCAQVRIAAVA